MMFDAVNELAVLGTTFFMMAIATVWYSPMLFGTQWLKELGVSEAEIEKTKQGMWKAMGATFVSYAAMLVLLGHVVAYASYVSLTPLNASFLVTLFVASLWLTSIIWENKSFTYYAISMGFYAFFIMVGTLMLEYWPW